MNIRWNAATRIAKAAIAMLAWLALAMQLYLMIAEAPTGAVLERVINYFSFFTILTNFLVALGLTTSLLMAGMEWGRFFSGARAQAGIAVYIAIVGTTYSLLLRQLWSPEGAQKLADVLLHDVVPVTYVLYWLTLAPKTGLHWKDAFRWLIYPVAYILYTLAHGALSQWYPYPFVDAAAIGFPRALANGGLFLLVFLAAGLLAIALGQWLSRRIALERERRRQRQDDRYSGIR